VLAASRDRTRRQILIVEDDHEVRWLLRQVLLLGGWSVETAANAREAITLLEAQLPTIVLLDLSMPEMDGWAFLDRRRLEPDWQRVPVLAMSGMHDQATEALHRGANGFLPKPFAIEELREMLSDLVDDEPEPHEP
jgi:CheY-like chemotaxis protein